MQLSKPQNELFPFELGQKSDILTLSVISLHLFLITVTKKPIQGQYVQIWKNFQIWDPIRMKMFPGRRLHFSSKILIQQLKCLRQQRQMSIPDKLSTPIYQAKTSNLQKHVQVSHQLAEWARLLICLICIIFKSECFLLSIIVLLIYT